MTHHAREKPLPSPLACRWLEEADDEDDEEGEERDISKFPGATNGPRQPTSADGPESESRKGKGGVYF